jgi:hypothetical protein
MPAGNTYEAIATQTLGSAAASVTFSSIPGTYTDLVLVVAGTLTTGTENIVMQFNGDTGSNYSVTSLLGDGSTASSFRSSNINKRWSLCYGALHLHLLSIQSITIPIPRHIKLFWAVAVVASYGVDARCMLCGVQYCCNYIYCCYIPSK